MQSSHSRVTATDGDSGQIVDFVFGYINPAAERRLRTPREQFLGTVLSEVRPYSVSSGVQDRYKDVVRTGIPYIDEIFIDDGTIHATWIHIQAVKIYTTSNARAESTLEKTIRKGPFQHSRCLIPVDGFYEWLQHRSQA